MSTAATRIDVPFPSRGGRAPRQLLSVRSQLDFLARHVNATSR
ncbi:hypothetical protein [Mycobacterium simiae]|nr:hypothetical protein [Mycobacterium simiae]